MMDFLKQYQTAIGFVILVALLFAGYQFFFAGETGSVVSVSETSMATPDQDLVALLFELRSIRLDSALFENPLFTSLQDFGQDLVPEPIGRENPFAPLGASATVRAEP